MTAGLPAGNSGIMLHTLSHNIMGAAQPDQPEGFGWRDYVFYTVMIIIFTLAYLTSS